MHPGTDIDSTRPTGGHRPGIPDVLCLLGLLALNPITYLHGVSVVGMLPDSVLYTAAAGDLIGAGRLFVAGWAHADAGIILPPLYPLLTGMVQALGVDRFAAGEYVSSVAMIVSSWLLYLYAAPMHGRLAAFLVVAVIGLNYHYFTLGTAALTEAVFLATLALVLWWTRRALSTPRASTAMLIGLGVACALVALSRQIGVVFMAPVLLLVTARAWTSRTPRRMPWREPAAIAIGFAVLAVPYTVALYLQSGQLPTVQHFRLGEYVVEGNVASDDSAPETPATAGDPDYMAQIRKRREGYVLTPDATEIRSFLRPPGEERASEPARVTPRLWLGRIEGNLRHLTRTMGPTLAWLLLATLLTALALRRDDGAWWSRLPLPIFLITYLLGVSLITGLVERYVYVLFGLVTLHVFEEGYRHVARLKAGKPGERLRAVAALAIASVLLGVTPRLFTAAEHIPKTAGEGLARSPCAGPIEPREPVFGLHPVHILALGGTYRILPNDSPDRIAHYAQRTTVRWILLARTGNYGAESALYRNAPWLGASEPSAGHEDSLALECVDSGGVLRLYRILAPAV